MLYEIKIVFMSQSKEVHVRLCAQSISLIVDAIRYTAIAIEILSHNV